MSNRFCCTDPDIRLLAAGRVRFVSGAAVERAMAPLIERARRAPTGTLADVFRDVDTDALLFVAAWRVTRFEAAESTVVDAIAHAIEPLHGEATVDLEIWKEIVARPDISDSAADFLAEPVLVTRARGTYVVKKEHSRGPQGRATG